MVYKHTEKTKEKMRLAKLGEKNPMWKGDNVGKSKLHEWIRRHKPKPELCEICKVKPPFDVANISQKYYRDINDFEWICRGCHMKKDGRKDIRINNLKQASIRRNNEIN